MTDSSKIIADADLVVVTEPKLDVSEVDALSSEELTAKLASRNLQNVPNWWLVKLTEQYPENVARLTMYATQESLDKAARLKEKYGLVLKEIERRKAAAVEVVK